MPKLNANANAKAEVKMKVKVVLLSVAVSVALCLSAAVAMAGTVGPTFTAPFDFDHSGESDVLLHRLVGTNAGINEVQIVSGLTSISRGWPDLNTDNGGSVVYLTRGAGNFDGNANGQAQIMTRKQSNPFDGLIRIVRLDSTGIVRNGQFFIGTVGPEWSFFGIGDCNGDGTDDFVFHKTGGGNLGLVRIVFMDPGNPFQPLNSSFPNSLPAVNQPLAVADADGDGQADLWTLDTVSGAIEILISHPDIALGTAAESAQMPATLPANNQIAGVGIFNRADNQADILFEALGAAAIPGLLRLVYSGDNGGPANAQTLSFPTLLDDALGETIAGIGDYDGQNQQDLLTRLQTPVVPANTGVLTVRLMDSDGSDLAGSSGQLPEIENLDYRVIDGASVVSP